jgi:putative tricarboxylic transport membrane protein
LRIPSVNKGGKGIEMTKEGNASLVFLLVGLYGLIFSLQLPMGKWREPGPGVFPLGLSILLSLSGILWFICGKGRRQGKPRADARELLKKVSVPMKIVLITAVFIPALNPLGYLLTASLYMFFLFMWVSRYKLRVAIGLAVSLGVGSWLFFAKFLAVNLPAGLLFR